jgi:hypothetical protein
VWCQQGWVWRLARRPAGRSPPDRPDGAPAGGASRHAG